MLETWSASGSLTLTGAYRENLLQQPDELALHNTSETAIMVNFPLSLILIQRRLWGRCTRHTLLYSTHLSVHFGSARERYFISTRFGGLRNNFRL